MGRLFKKTQEMQKIKGKMLVSLKLDDDEVIVHG